VLYSNEPGYTRELKMPDGVMIEKVLPVEDLDGGGDRSLVLVPGATTPAIGVELANRHGTRRTVQLDPMTGFPRVAKAEDQ
jgi:hypothetical protein